MHEFCCGYILQLLLCLILVLHFEVNYDQQPQANIFAIFFKKMAFFFRRLLLILEVQDQHQQKA